MLQKPLSFSSYRIAPVAGYRKYLRNSWIMIWYPKGGWQVQRDAIEDELCHVVTLAAEDSA